VQRNLLGSQDFTDIQAANQEAWVWIEQVAGQRIHGTTRQRPLVQFQEVEQVAMLPLPSEPYDLAVWKEVRVGRDCYVNFEKAYYSAPYRLVGQEVWVPAIPNLDFAVPFSLTFTDSQQISERQCGCPQQRRGSHLTTLTYAQPLTRSIPVLLRPRRALAGCRR
jgi:hypothetical protein